MDKKFDIHSWIRQIKVSELSSLCVQNKTMLWCKTLYER